MHEKTMNKSKYIEVVPNSVFMFMAHPEIDSYMYGVEVSLVKKNKELHFILQQSEGSSDEPLLLGFESAICLQVIRAFREETEGKLISNVHFYAYYAKSWRHITFSKFEPDLIKKSWPDCDTGEALGIIQIEIMNVSKRVKLSVKNDYSAHPFYYWWHSVEAEHQIFNEYQQELIQALRSSDKSIEFGKISYIAAQKNEYKCIFARHKDVLIEQITKLSETKEITYQTPVIQAENNRGWVAIVVFLGELEVRHHIYEPGNHYLDDFDFDSVKDDIAEIGCEVETIGDNSLKVRLHREIDLTPITGRMALFRRGVHEFHRLSEVGN